MFQAFGALRHLIGGGPVVVSPMAYKVVQEGVRLSTVATLLYLVYITALCPCELMFSCHARYIYAALSFVFALITINFLVPWQH